MGGPLTGSGKPLVITSGTLVMPTGMVATEQDAPDPQSLGTLRIAGERACLGFAKKGVRSIVLRLAPTVHGPGDSAFIPFLISTARRTGVSAYIADGADRWPASPVAEVPAVTITPLFLTRSEDATAKLRSHGVEHVLITSDKDFAAELGKLAAELGTTAMFDGVGGELTSRIAPTLPMYSAIYFYGFLGAAAPVTIPSLLIMAKNLVLKRFSNFASETVGDPQRLTAAITYLEGVIDDPLFQTRVGKEFAFDHIDAAMAYEATPGAKAVLVP
jgi:hypothetical protein